jgi:hypothetical protein
VTSTVMGHHSLLNLGSAPGRKTCFHFMLVALYCGRC